MTQTHEAKKDFWKFFFSSIFSILSIDIFVFNHGWYLLELGSKRLSVSFGWGIFFLPGLFLLPLTQKLIRTGRFRDSILKLETAKFIIFLFAIFAVFYLKNSVTIYIILGLLGCTFAPFYPLTYGLLKKLFKDKNIVRFSNLTEVSFQVAGAAALLCSGFIYKSWGFVSLTLIAAIASLSACLLLMRISESNALEENLTNEPSSKTVRKTFHFSKILFGFVHNIPQISILLLNIPLLLYVEQIMSKGPREYGIIDASFGIVAMLVSSFWAYHQKLSSKLSTFIVFGFLAGFSFLFVPEIASDNFMPYIAIAFIGLSTTSIKIMARGQLMLSHDLHDIQKYTNLYQAFTNLVLVFGAFGFGYVIQNYSALTCFKIIGYALILFTLVSISLLKQIQK